MAGKRWSVLFSGVRRSLGRWREGGSAAAMVLLLVVGTRIVAPDIDSKALADFLRSGGGGPVLGLYDLLVGGALTRGALLAIGVMPYLSARIYLRLARVSFSSFAPLARDQVRLQRWTRGLTFGFALVQSYGFARFLQSVPGVVTDPGLPFTLRTVALLTGSAMTVAWLSERISAAGAPDSSSDTDIQIDRAPVSPALPPERFPPEPNVTAREKVRVSPQSS